MANPIVNVGCLTIYDDNRFILKNVPTWYAQFAEPRAFEEGQNEKYSITAFLDKDKHAEEIKALNEFLPKQMAEGKKWNSLEIKKRCFADCAELEDIDEDSPLMNMHRLRFSANATFPPVVRNASGDKLNRDDSDDMAQIRKLSDNGRIATILSSPYGWAKPKYGAGVVLNLLAIKASSKHTDLKLGASGNFSGDDLKDVWDADEDEDDIL